MVGDTVQYPDEGMIEYDSRRSKGLFQKVRNDPALYSLSGIYSIVREHNWIEHGRRNPLVSDKKRVMAKVEQRL